MRASEAQPILDAFGYLQHGLVTSAQAAESGVDSTTMTRLAQRDVIRRVRRGVYILAGVAEDALTEIRAAWLATSPRVLAEDRLAEETPIVVSHVSAASMLDLGDITPARHTFSSPLRKQSSAADIRHRIAALPDDDITVVEGIAVTTALRTVVDLARDHLDGDQLHHVIADAIHNHRVKVSAISERLAPYIGDYGYDSGAQLVAESLRRFPEDESSTEAAQFSALARALEGLNTSAFEGAAAEAVRGLRTSMLKNFLDSANYPNLVRSIGNLDLDYWSHVSQAPWEGVLRQNADFAARIAGSFDPSWMPALGETAAQQVDLNHVRELGADSTEPPSSDHHDDGQSGSDDD